MIVRINKRALTRRVEFNVRMALIEVGEKLTNSIRSSMVPGTGRKYKRKGRRDHVASIAGRPPAPWTRRLHDSITYSSSFGDKSDIGPRAKSSDGINKPTGSIDEHVLSIGTNVPYALALEKGVKRGLRRGRIDSRPFLWPSLKRSRGIIKKAFTRY